MLAPTQQRNTSGVHLSGSGEPGVDPVLIDAGKIGRVLANLVDNALRHTERGGRVQVQAAAVTGVVLVEVADTGEGIPAGDLAHLFEQFHRSEKSRNRATGGAGLGLAIARGVVEAHGGTMGVDSAPGSRARFYFTLPRSGGQAQDQIG